MNTTTHPSNPPATATGFAEAQLQGADVAYWFAIDAPEPGSEYADGVYVTAKIPGIDETFIMWVKPKPTFKTLVQAFKK